LFILAAGLSPFGAFDAYVLLLAAVLFIASLSGISFRYLLKRSFIALPFALAAVTLPFTVPGQTWATIPLLGGITVTIEGTVRFLSILIKSWISVQMAILLVSLTPFPDMMWALQALHIPKPLVAIVSFMYRYLFVLSDEVLRLIRARASRSARVDGRRSGGTLLWRGQVAGRMAGSLMLRSFERSERIYNAMASRGYQGQFRTFSRPGFNRADFLSLGVGILYLAAVLLIAYR
jgi:cobalt/nickel transport system permease protein